LAEKLKDLQREAPSKESPSQKISQERGTDNGTSQVGNPED
jgi:hypothetical protein